MEWAADRRRKPWLIAGAWVAGAAAAFVGGLALFTHRATRPPRKRRTMRGPEDLPCEDVSFEALDGVRLDGWYISVPEPRAVVMLCHGYLGNREGMVAHARFLHAAGYAALLFDFRAQGESRGNLCTFGYQEALDVRGAVRYLQERPDTAYLPLAGLGLSMGAVALVMAAPETPELKAIVADGMYPSLAQAISRRCDLLFGPVSRLAQPIINHFMSRRLGARPEEVSPLVTAGQLAEHPVLFIHAGEDIYLAAEHAEALHEGHAGPKALWQAATAPHIRAIRVEPEAYAQRVLGFFGEYVTRKS
jgi:fermentation-respiration switch protein FrsA (DUF1100 family)